MRLTTGSESVQVQYTHNGMVIRLTSSSSFHPPPVSCVVLEMTHLTSPEQYKVICLIHKASGHAISKKLTMCSN